VSAVATRSRTAPRPSRTTLPALASRISPATAAALAVVVVVVLTHGINMFGYPYLEADEGTYFSQGWAVFHDWRLAPYTYFYDHAPVGWIQLALWQAVTGDGLFGYGLASGRVFMLVLQVGSALLLFTIALRVSGRVWVALLAVSLFALSAYGIHYHRRILLDNVATFWILVSLLLIVSRLGLRRVWLSALALGMATLSKEVAVALIPAFAVLVARRVPRESRVFAVTGWLALTLAVVSLYPLIALLKGEFFPSGTSLGGDEPHVSLVCSLLWQSSRSADGGLLNTSSAFWAAATTWIEQEPLLVIGGTAAAIVAVVAYRRDAVLSMVGWSILSLWLFIGRGGVVLIFYLVPMLPLFALTLALLSQKAADGARRRVGPGLATAIAGAAFAGSLAFAWTSYGRTAEGLWTQDPVEGQVQASDWVAANVPKDARMIIDMSMFHDLRHRSGFRNSHYYWRAGQDPQVRRETFGDDWRQVDYVITTPQLVHDTAENRFPVVAAALEHSLPVRSFDTGGWTVVVRRVDPQVEGMKLPPASGATTEAADCAGVGA
jgi:4-amino-4-deoxy-L-arabinose transferase-like glycosyltransferase